MIEQSCHTVIRSDSNLDSKLELSAFRPLTRPDVTISRRNATEEANQQTDGVIRHVLRVSFAGVCDGDAAAVALGEVDVVGADAGADDELERREAGEEAGVDREPADADDGSDGGGVTGEEEREWV